jgi:hypothetical protein
VPEMDDFDRSSALLARRALITTTIMALGGAILGLAAVLKGITAGAETALILSSLLFTSGILFVQLFLPNVALQLLTTSSTIFFAIYLCTGLIISVTYAKKPSNLFVYLAWFFPLLVFNKLVNAPAAGRLLAKFLRLTPVLLLGCLVPRLIALFPRGAAVRAGSLHAELCGIWFDVRRSTLLPDIERSTW